MEITFENVEMKYDCQKYVIYAEEQSTKNTLYDIGKFKIGQLEYYLDVHHQDIIVHLHIVGGDIAKDYFSLKDGISKKIIRSLILNEINNIGIEKINEHIVYNMIY